MKKFDYTYALLQNGVLTNSDGTNIRKKSSTSGFEVFDNSWDQYLEDAIVPEITYTETNAVSVDKTVKAWTFYCDSLSGCVEGTEHYEDGDGSKENPWRSLDYALRQIQTKLNCWRSLGCYCFRKGKYFQLKVKGTVDYNIFGQDSAFVGYETVDEQVIQFIISPWENGKWIYSGNYMYHVYGTVFNGLQIGTSEHSSKIYGSGVCLFNHVDIVNGYFVSCHGTRFIDLSATRTTYDYVEILFTNCIGSDLIGFRGRNIGLRGGLRGNLYNVDVYIRDNSDKIVKDIYGISGFSGFGFYNCSADVGGTLNCESVETTCYNESTGEAYPCTKYYGYVDACGFYDNMGSTFYNCTMTNQCDKCADETHVCRTPDF